MSKFLFGVFVAAILAVVATVGVSAQAAPTRLRAATTNPSIQAVLTIDGTKVTGSFEPTVYGHMYMTVTNRGTGLTQTLDVLSSPYVGITNPSATLAPGSYDITLRVQSAAAGGRVFNVSGTFTNVAVGTTGR